MAGGGGGLAHLPLASRRQIYRSLQKDKAYGKLLFKEIEGVVNAVVGAANATNYKAEAEAIVDLCYEALARNSRNQTLGQEDCDLLPMWHPSGQIPSKSRLGLLVLFRIGLPYSAGKLYSSSTGIMSLATPAYRSLRGLVGGRFLPQLSSYELSSALFGILQAAERGCLLVFFLNGLFPQLAYRLSRVSFFSYDEISKTERQPHYRILGWFLILAEFVKYVERRHSASESLESDGQGGSEGNLKFFSNKEKSERAPASQSSDAALEHEAKCPLCLSNVEFPTSTPCGHVFCWSCILHWCNQKEECPLCRSGADTRDLVCMHHIHI
ncbi:peroxisome biogenesis protein [Chloropicon primus]|nr:peroxisome biogenesis protein [Chloropicon primus]